MTDDTLFMQRAIDLARQGEGHVEPNPMVGAVVVRHGQVVGEGYHQKFGGPHAEVHALAAAGESARGATLYVTLEPCCHTGKTPPCTQAVLAAGIARVVVAVGDPFPQVDGGGIAQLRAAGIECEVGVLEREARYLLAPYLKLVTTGKPWVIAKWAMTLDGKMATHTGSSQWISGESSRAVVHKIRGRMDAIVVGSGTVHADDPLLTARPAGPRVPVRVVLGDLTTDTKLAQTMDEAPLMVVRQRDTEADEYQWLLDGGGELWISGTDDRLTRINLLLDELGSRRMTNVLVEGGGKVLGALFDAHAVDEVHVFIAPKIVGGEGAPTPVAGLGLSDMAAAWQLVDTRIETLGTDMYLSGRLPKS
ncbi:bifunctional diaminohydroxyphosphoribosylaminopyrimidine deaminase/5-amino-6-(5-phosphoribosylamino)uracil reductase RibD [Aeoliella mucimassa]|uniref:Riboflavin biosynthesis protein RibD n=1 Tax=Aeoliella mucimassa TaxID=2527972 RepID=A0A518AGW8_9BACT|nr:bifunctional diaminohydroxyphosphoribosylaminopyrimidine deaminase/5-amino-6-(5-phosphoribosylamino)uracil reductase RibD [Aeoliella mucimassa]QDU53944.1 Riboflavin biosynthesis protein RibD [Aeoliella mucimassa]